LSEVISKSRLKSPTPKFTSTESVDTAGHNDGPSMAKDRCEVVL